MKKAIATRIAGSADLYQRNNRRVKRRGSCWRKLTTHVAVPGLCLDVGETASS
jgi:hypothetical protein